MASDGGDDTEYQRQVEDVKESCDDANEHGSLNRRPRLYLMVFSHRMQLQHDLDEAEWDDDVAESTEKQGDSQIDYVWRLGAVYGTRLTTWNAGTLQGDGYHWWVDNHNEPRNYSQLLEMHRKRVGYVGEWFTNGDVAVGCGDCESDESDGYRDVIDDGTDSTDSRQPYQ